MKEYKLEKIKMGIEDHIYELKRHDSEGLEEYKKNLLRRLRLRETQIKDTYNEMTETKIKIDRAKKHKYTEGQVYAIVAASSLAGSVGLSALAYYLYGEDIFNNTAAAASTAGSVLVGAFAGGVAGVISGALLEKKPLSRAYYSIKKHILARRLDNLNNKVYADLYARGVLQKEGCLPANGEDLEFGDSFEN